jgi:hypothetical protein
MVFGMVVESGKCVLRRLSRISIVFGQFFILKSFLWVAEWIAGLFTQ